MTANRVVIVGAGPAGDAAAISLRKNGYEGEVVLVGSDQHQAYERPYLSKQFLRGEAPLERVFVRPAEEYERQDIRLLKGRTVVGASAQAQEVELDSGERLTFDIVVLATGATPRWLPDAPRVPNIFALRTLDDGMRLKRAIDGAEGVLLVGAGFIGAEIAASARVLGKSVIMVEMGSVPLSRALGEDVGRFYAQLHRSRGVDLRAGTAVAGWIVEGGRLRAVELSDGTRHQVDLAVVGIGVSPNVDLAGHFGLQLGMGGVLADDSLRAAPNIYVAGDIAAHLHPVYGRHIRVEHWQVAQRQGAAVGASIAGEPKQYVELPWFWSDQYDVNLQYVGNSLEFDQTVWRGDQAAEKFSVFYLRKGLIEAVMSVNDGRTGRFSRELITNHVPVAPDVLGDVETDLRELARSAALAS